MNANILKKLCNVFLFVSQTLQKPEREKEARQTERLHQWTRRHGSFMCKLAA